MLRRDSSGISTWPPLQHAAGDLRLALRALRRVPLFTFASVSSLALGLALVATTMAVVNAYLVRSMPFPAADRLYRVIYAPGGGPEPRGISALDWSALADVVELADNSAPTRFLVADGRQLEEVAGLQVARGSLEALGLHASVGRTLLNDDFGDASERVALIGHALWHERFAGDPRAVGQLLSMRPASAPEQPETFRIVGVLPPGFRHAREYARGETAVVVPLRTPLRTYMVRLREGVPVPYAAGRITEAVKRVGSSFPPAWEAVRLESIHEGYVAGIRPTLVAVTVAAAFVLLIVSVNVAVLMLLRAIRRQKEVAVRVAIGARRSQILRMIAAETVLVCGTALAAGLLLTRFSLGLLAPMIEERLGRAAPGGTAAISLDSTVLVVVGLAGVLIAGALSLVPLLAPWQRRLAGILQGDGRSATDVRSARWARSALVAAEVALSIALLAGSGLMIRTVVNLMQTDLGFATTDVRRARIALPPRSYPDAPAFLTIYDRFIERMRAMSDGPFTVTSFIPFWEAPKQGIEIQGQRVDGLTVGVTAATEGYFATFGIDILQGRGLTAVDRPGSEPVAVVSQSLARRFWPNGDAIGQRIRTAEEQVPGSPLTVWRTIIGVVADARQTHTDSDLQDVYISFLQAPNRFARVFVRTERSQSEWIDLLRRAGTEFDPDVLITAGTPLATEAQRELAGPRFLMSLLTGFAAFAGLLAILGVYSVTACVVQQREREVAIRIALGATSRGIVLMFLRQGGAVLSLGIGLGLLGAAGVARTLESQLHGVRPFDGATLVAACLVIAGGGLTAIWWPSRRAATAPPIDALKEG